MTDNKFALPIYWNDYEDIAIELYEKFGDDFDESKYTASALPTCWSGYSPCPTLPASARNLPKVTLNKFNPPGFMNGGITSRFSLQF